MGSSLIGISAHGGIHVFGVHILAFIGFVIAFVLGVWEIVSIVAQRPVCSGAEGRPGRSLAWGHGCNRTGVAVPGMPTGRGDDLAAELGVHRVTAEALIRRGYDRRRHGADVSRRRRSRPRPAVARRHGRGLRADPGRDRRRPADLHPRRLRRRRHLRHRGGGARAARVRCQCGVAPAQPLRGGLRPRRRHGRAAGDLGRRASDHRRLRHHRRRSGGARRRTGDGGDRHRSPPARRGAAGLSAGVHATVRVRVPRPVRQRRSPTSSRGRCSRPRAGIPPSSISTSIWWRSQRSPTWCR